jgi:hypothetical protein
MNLIVFNDYFIIFFENQIIIKKRAKPRGLDIKKKQ